MGIRATENETTGRRQRRASQPLLQLVHALPQPVANVDIAQRYLFVNDAYAAQFGVRAEDLVGRSVRDVLSAETYAMALPFMEAALAGQRGHREVAIAFPAIGLRRVEVTYVPDVEPSGAIAGCFISINDITEHKRTEQALRESEQRFREMTDRLPLMVWMHDASGAQELVNETFCEFFGVSREEMKGGRWQVLMHPDDAAAYVSDFERCVRERRPFQREARVRRYDGEWRWVASWGRPRFSETGEFRGFVGTSSDVTARRQADDALRRSQHALRDSEQRFRNLADAMPQLVWAARDDGTVVYYNSRATQYRGLTCDAQGVWQWEPVVHPDERAATEAAWRAALQSRASAYECEHRLCMADGAYRWHLSRAYRLSGPDEDAHWFGTATDIHEMKEAQEALREADRRKDEFLAMLGHELRNPLAAIRNATDLVKLAQPRESRLQRAYEVLERQSAHMSRLVGDLLEVTRIARGKIQLDRSTLDLREIVAAVLSDRAREISHRALSLHEESPAEPLWVLGDPVRLAQVVDNLIGNAIKFTDAPGSIRVELSQDGEDAVLAVRDSGVGIRAELLPRIFEPFQQEMQDMARAKGGLGLGLALAKSMVEMHGGSITAHSAGPGAGTELCVRLPRATAPANAAHAGHAARATQTRRILLVEDNADAAEALRTLLELRGHEVAVADNGVAALDHLRRESPEVVLCDLGLPDMNGYDFARAARADHALRDSVLVALTGYGQPEDRKRTRDAGFDEHLVKPVSLHVLDRVLERFGAHR